MVTKDFWDPPETRASFPAVAIGGTSLGFARALLNVLAYYAWFHVTVLVEIKVFSTFYLNAALSLQQNINIASEPFDFQFVKVEDATDEVIKQFLHDAKQRSRGTCSYISMQNCT